MKIGIEIETKPTTTGYIALHPTDPEIVAYGVTERDAAEKMAAYRRDREQWHAPETHFDRCARLRKSAQALTSSDI